MNIEEILYQRIADKINAQREKAGLHKAAGGKLDEIVKQKLFVIYALVNEEMGQILNTKIRAFNDLMKVTPQMYKMAQQVFFEEIRIYRAYNECVLKLNMSDRLALESVKKRFKI